VKASDLLVRCLEAEGIEYIFGVPGEENADFMISLESSKQIRFVLTRQEQGAAFMAEAYGRLTGNPAGCLGTLGPGATNLITGVADSNMDRAPMLVLTGQGSTDRLHKESHQIMDVVGMFHPVTKWATSILNPDTIPEIVRKAVRVARTEKPGAVHIELPEDIAAEESDEKPIIPRRFRRSVPDDEIVDRAFALLRESKRPVILAGNGCIRRRASAELRAFCERTGVGVINTFMAKGCVDMDAPYCLYTIGLGSRDRASGVIDDADLVITLGFDMVEYHPQLWNPRRDKNIVHADFLAAEIDSHYHPEVELIGDLAHTLWMLNERLDAAPPLDLDLSMQHRCRADMAADFAEYRDDATEGTIRPQKVLWDVRQAMGPHDVLLSDVGAHKMWIARYYQCDEPNTCLISNGFCSMGFAFPAAMGAWAAVKGQRKVLAVAGDGGFGQYMGEFTTAVKYGMNITLVLLHNDELGKISKEQRAGHWPVWQTSLQNPNFADFARNCGGAGIRVEHRDDLPEALRAGIASDVPCIVEVMSDSLKI